MILRKLLIHSFVTVLALTDMIHTQDYLSDLHPKEIQFDLIRSDLPPVELPTPLLRHGRSKSFDDKDEHVVENKNMLRSQRPSLIDVTLAASVNEGLNAMQRVYGVIEPDMIKSGHTLERDHPGALLSKFSAPVTDSKHREMAAFATITATKAFWKSYNLNNELARQAHTQKVSLRRTALESLCPPRDPPACMPASERYRTHDGTCNNKRRPRWGAAQMPFSRFLPPEYGDGVDSVRKSAAGAQLASSRFVSLLVHGARDGEASLTLMLVQWGQLLDHDLTSTAQPKSINGSVPSCCGNNDFHPSCFPIKVPLDDPWLAPLKVRCLEFLRSAPAQRRDCVLSWREQTNQATSFIDASPIYSNSVKLSDNARVFRNGLLIYGRGNSIDDSCQRGAIATHCIRAGDGRSGEQPGLLALHLVWVGEHNRIAIRLSELNKHWSDEKIYQETRKIVGAMFQHITYREFLPIVLGREVTKLFDLELLSSGYYEGYDAKANPSVANSFAAAAFRFGHSLVQNSYTRCDRFHNVLPHNVSLHEEFQRGDIGSAGSLHRLIRGMANQMALKRDEFISPELTNHLFQTPGFPFGLDLAAINIQRGRDHGIPSYTNWRVPCGLSAVNTWEEFANVVGPESARRISHAYQNVHDIDLFVGGIAERPVVGGLVGPTFACIIAQQFSNSRKGDRFWYENGRMENSFTPAQLHSIRRVTLASVLCRAVGGGTFQPHIFLPPDLPSNERLPCGVGTLANFDLDPWMEQDPFELPTEVPHPQNLPSKTDESNTSGTPVLDRIFEVVQTDLENKIPNDIEPDNNHSANVALLNTEKTPLAAMKPEQLISHSPPPFQLAKNLTKIHDKLDFKRKGSFSHITRQKPLPGVSNKLEKHSRRGTPRPDKTQTTTRRTIIVNNIPIELRNIDRLGTRYEKFENQKDTNKDRKQLLKNNAELTDVVSGDKGQSSIEPKPNSNQNISNSTIRHNKLQKTLKPHLLSDDADIDPMTIPPVMGHIRVQRKFDPETPHELSFNLTTPRSFLKPNSTLEKLNKTESKKRLPLVNSELRLNPHRPTYTTPPKVIVDAGNGNSQYQIEINIRQSNKSPQSSQSTSFDNFTPSFQTFPYDNFPPSFANLKTTTPFYGYYRPSPTPAAMTTKKTKPPTIIFLNEHGNQAGTTRHPGFVHSIVGWSSVDQKPIVPGPNFNDRPTVSNPTPGSGLVSSFSHSQLGAGTLQATSQTSSDGQYGLITGFASANGADSTFSFNIRPRPDQTQLKKPELSGNFALTYVPSKTYYGEHIAPYDLPNREGALSPFSSGNSQSYFKRKKPRPQLKADVASYKDPEYVDYDFLSRARNPLKNVTNNDYLDADDVEYDEDYGNIALFKKFDSDGYLRPEYMVKNIMGSEDKDVNVSSIKQDNTSLTEQTLDDNYVLPAMNITQGVPKKDFQTPTNFSVNFPDSQSKHLTKNIFADDITTEGEKLKQHLNRVTLLKQTQKKIAFAPITILTKPERPDNWVFYDSIKVDPELPQIPDMKLDLSPSSEIPRPFIENIWFLSQPSPNNEIGNTPNRNEKPKETTAATEQAEIENVKLNSTSTPDPNSLRKSETVSDG